MNREPYSGRSLTRRELEILQLVASGLSNRDIAEELVVAPDTVRWYTKQIYNKLRIRGRVQAINRARELGLLDGKSSSDSTNKPPNAPKHNLPASTTVFVGRSREIAEVKHLLQTARLLTLTGVGGTGKTRLALQVASEVVDAFADGIYFVDLAPVTGAESSAKAIGNVLGVIEATSQPLVEALKKHLRPLNLLLILDNFEQIMMAAPVASELLSAASQLKILVTSRQALHLYGEQEYVVPPLALPNLSKSDNLAELGQVEAVTLFVNQARAVKPSFELKQGNAREVAQICVQLEGIPLAIELAAARIKLLTPQALLERLSNRLDTLTGGAQDLPARQQTLRQTIEWSHNLLDEDEKTLFARLAVFRGGASLEAIQAICDSNLLMNALDGLESLINKSLIQQREFPSGEPCFVMLETLHEFAWERLKGSSDANAILRKYAEYYVTLAERAAPELRLAQQTHWYHLLESEIKNIRAVLRWSLDEGDVSLGARLAGAMTLFWFSSGYHTEGLHWTEQLLSRLDEIPIQYQAKVLLLICGGGLLVHDVEKANHYFAQAIQISREIGDEMNLAWALVYMGYGMLKEPAQALIITEEALTIHQKLHNKAGIALAQYYMGEIYLYSGEKEKAKRAYKASLAISQEIGETRRTCYLYFSLAALAQSEGDIEQATECMERAFGLAIQMANKLTIAECLSMIGGLMGQSGQPELGAHVMGSWEAAIEQIGASIQPSDVPIVEANIAYIRAGLDEAAFRKAWTQGRAMSLDQAVVEALDWFGNNH